MTRPTSLTFIVDVRNVRHILRIAGNLLAMGQKVFRTVLANDNILLDPVVACLLHYFAVRSINRSRKV